MKVTQLFDTLYYPHQLKVALFADVLKLLMSFNVQANVIEMGWIMTMVISQDILDALVTN